MRHRYAREHGAFPGEQPSFPSDRQCLFECFERTVPCAVQDVRDPETQVACDSPELVPHLLRVFDRIPGVRQGRRALASHLTAEDVEGVRAPAHAQLWKRPLEHPVELACAIPKTPRETQNHATQVRGGEAWAEPDSMRAVVVAKERAETDISLSELNSLFHNGTALREPGAPKEANGQAVPNGDSQAEILRFVRAIHRFAKQIERFIDGSGPCPELAKAVQRWLTT
jgi:hypothetical protein